MAEDKNVRVKLKSNISSRLIGRSNLNEFNGKVKELCDIATGIAPEGGLYVLLVDRAEVFAPINRAVRALMDLDTIYSLRALQSNPELAVEFGKIAEAMKEIDNVVNKRRQAQRKTFEKREVKKND